MGAAVMGLGLHARCTPWFVPIVARKPKYLLNHVVISRYIAVIVSINKNRVDKLNLICKIWAGIYPGPYLFPMNSSVNIVT
jgi:hypothetical protein